ncbi:MAG: hypothetical protein OEL53_11090 [Rhodospirillales bacterium]|nr:hypothetical protein [Rhodospirillales bacterium]
MSSLIADFLKRLFTPPVKAGPVQAAPDDGVPAPKVRELTPERSALIAEAMRIYRQKQSLLAELPDIQREALTYIAMKAFLGQAPDAPKKKPDGKA